MKGAWERLGRLKVWVAPLCLGGLGYALVQQGRELLALRPTAGDWLQLAVATGVTTLSVAVNGAAWAAVLAWLKTPLPLVPVVVVFARTNVLKYIPGGVWHLVGRLRLLQGSGQGFPRALTAVLLDPLLMAVAALLVVPLGGWQAGLAMAAPAALLVLLPRWRDPLLRRLVRRHPTAGGETEGVAAPEVRSVATDRPVLPQGVPWWPLVAELLFVLTRFAGFALCAGAFLATDVAAPQLLAAFALAWTAGLVVPGAPAGLGVFELVLLLRLGGAAPEAPLLATAVAYRIVSTVADATAAAVASVAAPGQPRGI